MASSDTTARLATDSVDVESVAPRRWVAVGVEHRLYASMLMGVAIIEVVLAVAIGHYVTASRWVVPFLVLIGAAPQTWIVTREQTKMLASTPSYPGGLLGPPVFHRLGPARAGSVIVLTALSAFAVVYTLVGANDDRGLLLWLLAAIMAGQATGHVITRRRIATIESREGGLLVRLVFRKVEIDGRRPSAAERRALGRLRYVVRSTEAE